MLYRGDIVYIKGREDAVGSEYSKTRPAVIVSNDKANKYSPVIEVVYISSKPRYLPTHVVLSPVYDGDFSGTIHCEQITSVSVNRILRVCGHVSESCLEAINKCLKISIGIDA